MERERIHFGAVLDKDKPDHKVWLLVIPALALVVGGIVWGMLTVSRAGAHQKDAERAQAQVAELERSLDERDKLLVQARADEAVLESAGQATGLFLGVAKDATESGVAIADPDKRSVRVLLYGLVAPPQGQEYVVAARDAEGARKPLAAVIPSELGTGFVLAKELPEGTTAIELLLRDAGAEELSGATPRVAARYPSRPDERGMLMQLEGQPPAQARRAARR